MKKQIISFLFAVLFLTSFDSFALPRFAVKLGNRCIDCHYNPSGGLIRNLDGWNWGKNNLSMISTRDKDFIMSPRISDNISIGARLQNTVSLFPGKKTNRFPKYDRLNLYKFFCF